MTKRILFASFWVLFFGIFILLIIPGHRYLIDGFPEHLGKKTLFDKSIFTIHIISGIIVYITGVIQFTPSLRNKNISLHRKIGIIYIVASLFCIIALYAMLRTTLCPGCQASQYAATTFWLLFIVLAYYFIRQRKIQLHQRMMISSFICAAYFVTVRVIDRLAMGLFRTLFETDHAQFFASDISAWAVPLVIFHLYWIMSSTRKPSPV